jgi:hypothetical protein
MIPKIETNGQLNHLIDAIKKSVPDTAWHDASLWQDWYLSGVLPESLARVWNEVWTEEECHAILTNYTALRLER